MKEEFKVKTWSCEMLGIQYKFIEFKDKLTGAVLIQAWPAHIKRKFEI